MHRPDDGWQAAETAGSIARRHAGVRSWWGKDVVDIQGYGFGVRVVVVVFS